MGSRYRANARNRRLFAAVLCAIAVTLAASYSSFGQCPDVWVGEQGDPTCR